LLSIQPDSLLNDLDVARGALAKRRTVTPRTRSTPSGYSFCQVT
jgi:hypothetical protein